MYVAVLITFCNMSTSLTIPNVGMKPIGQRGGSVTVMNPMYAAQGGSVTIMQNVQAAPQYQCINPGNVSLAACLPYSRLLALQPH